MKDWIIARFKEASTYRGIVALFMVLGINLSPDQQTAIISACMTLIGAINITTPEKKG